MEIPGQISTEIDTNRLEQAQLIQRRQSLNANAPTTRVDKFFGAVSGVNNNMSGRHSRLHPDSLRGKKLKPLLDTRIALPSSCIGKLERDIVILVR